MWFIIDDSATFGWTDTAFGESKLPYDTSKFNVGFGYENDSAWKVSASSIGLGGSWTNYVRALNGELPITMKWDVDLIVNNNLPFDLKQALVENNYTFFNGHPNGYDLHYNTAVPENDSLLLPSFTIGGGPGEHFPLQVYFSKNSKSVGIAENPNNQIQLYPNPAESGLFIQSDENLSGTEIRIFDLQNREVVRMNLGQSPYTIPVSELPPGSYFLHLQREKKHIHRAFIKR